MIPDAYIKEWYAHAPWHEWGMDIRCRWFEGRADIPVYQIEELMATKLRTLYQRRKGRDLFDLAAALRLQNIRAEKVLTTFLSRDYGSAVLGTGTPIQKAIWEYYHDLV